MVRQIPRVEDILARLPTDEVQQEPPECEPDGEAIRALSDAFRCMAQRLEELETQLLKKQKEAQMLSYLKLRMERQQREPQVAASNEAFQREVTALQTRLQQVEETMKKFEGRSQEMPLPSSSLDDPDRFQSLQEQLDHRLESLQRQVAGLCSLQGKVESIGSSLEARLKALEERMAALPPDENFYYEYARKLAQRLERFQERLINLETRAEMSGFPWNRTEEIKPT